MSLHLSIVVAACISHCTVMVASVFPWLPLLLFGVHSILHHFLLPFYLQLLCELARCKSWTEVSILAEGGSAWLAKPVAVMGSISMCAGIRVLLHSLGLELRKVFILWHHE